MPYKDKESDAAKASTKRRNKKFKASPKYTNWLLQSRYNISLDTYNVLSDTQNGVCAICGYPETIGISKKLKVDHNHNTGKVRGLLCSRCNSALGFVNEDIEILENMIFYLERYK